MSRPKVLVLGDFMLDRYYLGRADRLSPEAPLPVVKVEKVVERPGGAGNVAENLEALGCEVIYPAVRYQMPVKSRLMVGDTQVARWDQRDRCEEIEGVWQAARGVNAIVVADYGKGSITKKVIEQVRQYLPVPVFVDTKQDPSPWLWTATAVFPNQKEYEQYRDKYDQFPLVVLKQGAKGISLLDHGDVIQSYPTQAKFVRSVSGAGDTVVSGFVRAFMTTSSNSMNCYSLDYCVRFANAAAAVVVEKPLTATATKEEVMERMGTINGEVLAA